MEKTQSSFCIQEPSIQVFVRSENEAQEPKGIPKAVVDVFDAKLATWGAWQCIWVKSSAEVPNRIPKFDQIQLKNSVQTGLACWNEADRSNAQVSFKQRT